MVCLPIIARALMELPQLWTSYAPCDSMHDVRYRMLRIWYLYAAGL